MVLGSTLTGVLLPSSDLDIVVVPGPDGFLAETTFFGGAPSVLRRALNAHVLSIPARVPILKVSQPLPVAVHLSILTSPFGARSK